MAVYKVPQDVEAEDKLIGPLSFRQFIYLMIAVASAFMAFVLFQLTPFLVIVPLPFVLLFGGLALPLRKDQPMEVYVLAIVRFLLKSRMRLWNPDGTITYVEITAPKSEALVVQQSSQEVTEQRLDYLSRIMDSRGWSMKQMNVANASVAAGVADEAARATDIMDEHADLARSFDDLIAKKNLQYREAALQTMRGVTQVQATAPTIPSPVSGQNVLERQFAPLQQNPEEPVVAPRFNPYPTIHQKVIQPYDAAQQTTASQISSPAAPETAMPATVSPDIMRLANNTDLSISAIAREAHRLQEGDAGEVIVDFHH